MLKLPFLGFALSPVVPIPCNKIVKLAVVNGLPLGLIVVVGQDIPLQGLPVVAGVTLVIGVILMLGLTFVVGVTLELPPITIVAGVVDARTL